MKTPEPDAPKPIEQQVKELYALLKKIQDEYEKERADYISKFMREHLWRNN